jgi:hypothetical protein
MLSAPKYLLSSPDANGNKIDLDYCRECGLHSPTTSSNEIDFCAVCLERPCTVAAEGTGF